MIYLLIQPGAAIALLQSAGFELSHGAVVWGMTPWGALQPFCMIEIPQRDVRPAPVDRSSLACDSRTACCRLRCRQRGEVRTHGQPVRTLLHRDAMVHACRHATTDRWMALRNMVDIERTISSAQLVGLRRIRLVRKSWQASPVRSKENALEMVELMLCA